MALAACVEEIRLTADSPDGTARVELVDRSVPLMIDRNFLLFVEDPISGLPEMVFRSPDEGPPGTERIVWSRDSQRFVVLGKKFSVRGEALAEGEQLYLLYDRGTGDIWCNATQQRLASFYLDELTDREWTEPIGPVGGPPPAERPQVVVHAPQPTHEIPWEGTYTVELDVENRGTVADEYQASIDVWKMACRAEPERFRLEKGARMALRVSCELPPPQPEAGGGFRRVTVFVEGSQPEITKGWDSFSLARRR